MTRTKPPLPAQPLTARHVFARNMRRARRMKELSQEALSLDTGISRAYLSKVELGETNVSIDYLDTIAKALKVPLRDLVDPQKFADLDEHD